MELKDDGTVLLREYDNGAMIILDGIERNTQLVDGENYLMIILDGIESTKSKLFTNISTNIDNP